MARSLGGALLAVVALLAMPGCGAKTGLHVPDAALDSGPDAGVDASRDAGLDAGDAHVPCVELDPDAGPLELPLDTEVQVQHADVVFVIDITGSMMEEIGHIRAELRDTIAPGIQASIPDSQIGVATFADFPVLGCGCDGTSACGAADPTYTLVTPVTDDLARVQSAVGTITNANGADPPEAQVEALYQTATGEGIGGFVPPSFGCPGGGFGYACFRSDALPVILLFTDDLWHDGPPSFPGGRPSDPFAVSCPDLLASVTPHTYDEARQALVDRGIRMIGLFSGTDLQARREMDQAAIDTNAVNGTAPLTFDIGTRGERLSSSVIDAIRTLAAVIRLDIDTVLVNPNPGGPVDPRSFVASITPLRADPMDGVQSIDVAAGVFRQVRTGTRVVFQLTLRNDAVAPGRGPQHFPLEIVFRADGRTTIGSTTIDIVVPGTDGSGCAN